MADFNMKERGLKPEIIRRDTNTNMRRFSTSNWKSFREDERFLRSSTTISSTVSSPGCTTTDKIDPSTYSFTAALKALQTRGWEYLPSEKLTLHSKWSDAEKYISNPFSGEVPVECLSAKTLSARSLSTLTNRITISAPLHFQTKINPIIQEKKMSACALITRDVGIQSPPAADISAPATPSIEERSMKHSEGESVDSSLSVEKDKPKGEVEEREAKEKEVRNTKEGRERKKKKKKKKKMTMMCSQGGEGRRGCLLSLKAFWLQRRNKCNYCNCKPRINNNPSSLSPTFLYHINASYDV